MTVYILADDFTGANDSIARFTKVNAKLVSLFGTQYPVEATRYQVVAMTTHSRGVAAEAAYRLTLEAVRSLPLGAADILYKKMDSALRGNIGPEIDAILDATGKVALLAPALPENQRITCGGYQLIDGIPVHETEMADDPVTPVRESHLPTLLARTSRYKVGYLPLRVVGQGTAKTSELLEQLLTEGCRIIVADATQNSHLEILAQVCKAHSSVIVPGGTAGLPGTLAGQLFPPQPFAGAGYLKNDLKDGIVAAVIGSKSRNAASQINQAVMEQQWLEAIAVQRKAIGPAESRAAEIQRVMEQVYQAIANGKRGVVIRFDADPKIDGASLSAADLADGLGETAKILAEGINVNTFYLSGGDIAISSVSKLQGWGVTVEGELEPGVCYGILQGGKFEGTRIITKAGSFGDSGTLSRLLQMSIGC